MFHDIKRVSYHRLLEITKNQKPYAKSSNAYPLGAREYSDRHFRVNDDGTFDCYYSNRIIGDDIQRGVKQARYWDAKFATIYPDNSMSFNKTTNAQSENLILQNMLCKWVHHDKSRGGTVIGNAPDGMHAVFDGLRINLETYESVEPYIVNVRKLNQKLAKEYLAQYGDFKQIAKVMIDPMSDQGIRETIIDLRAEFKEQMDIIPRTLVVKLLDQKRIVDAAIMFASVENLSYINWNSQSGFPLGGRFKNSLFNKIDKKFNQIILQETDIPFILKPYEGGKPFPRSTWGYVIVQNNEVKTRL